MAVFWLINKPKINLLALNVLLIFFTTQLISLLHASNIWIGFVRLKELVITGIFALYLSSQDKKNIQNAIISPLLISLIFESLLSLTEVFLAKSVGFWVLGERTFTIATPLIAKFNWFGLPILRPYATFPHPNVLAAFLVLILPIITLWGNKKNLIYKLHPYILILTLITLILTFSRAAFIVLIFELALFFIDKFKYVLIILTILSPLIFVRFDSAIYFDNLAISRRVELARLSIEPFLQNPLFGIGINNFILEVSSVNSIPGQNRFLQPVHNIFLLTFTETGIIGFIGLSILIFFPLVKVVFSNSMGHKKILIFIWLSVIFLGMLDHYFLTLPQGLRLFFLLWGLTVLELGNGFTSKNSKTDKLANTREINQWFINIFNFRINKQ